MMIRSINLNISIISLLLCCNVIFAQSVKELGELKKNIPEKKEIALVEQSKSYNSEYDLLFVSLFTFYKKFISSQDASSCSFTPSCSEYAILAIKKQGIIEGLANFWDRFSRCNGKSPEHYKIDYDKKLLIDPVIDMHYHVE